MVLEPGAAVSLVSREQAALESFRGRRVHAFAGIGNPGRFFAMLRARGIEGREHAFDDHHRFEPGDFATGDDDPILMTEKDAVKCDRFADRRMWYVPVTAHLPDADAARLLGAVGAVLSGGGAGA
jgi:tetraacyldisaccharide 4'-kinase